MKEKKMLGILRKVFKDADEFEKQVFKLAFKRMGGTPADAQGVLYSKSGKRLVGAQKSLEGTYEVRPDTREIGDKAFWGCALLRKVVMPESVLCIGDEAFGRCVSLESVVVPSSVEEMGRNPFVGLDSKVIDNQSSSFVIESKLLYDADRTMLVSCLTDASMVILPKTLRSVGGLAFKGRKKLKRVQLPEGLDRICRGAFAQCDSLEEVVIPATVVSIDGGAFSDCKGLKKLTFMGQPNRVARTAFAGCDQLDRVVVPDDGVPYFSEKLHFATEMLVAKQSGKQVEEHA